MMKAEDYANKVCDFLKNNGFGKYSNYGCPTKRIAREIDIPATSHDTLLKALERLRLVGVLNRSGGGKYIWKLKVESWNRHNPFEQVVNDSEESDTSSPYTTYTISKTKEILDDLDLDDYSDPEVDTPPKAEVEATKRYYEFKDRIEYLERTVATLANENCVLQAEIEKVAKASAHQSFVKTLEIKKWDGKITKLKDVILPKTYEKVLALASMRQNILLVGPAGCGKTYLAKLVADSLKLDFGALSCTAGMSETHLLGRSVPDLTHGKNRFQSAEFLDLYEAGGLMLLDEFDAADPNLLLAVNTALANNYCNVPNRPDKPKAKRHADFICIGTANTHGRGSNRLYSGRNQIDEATMDRFRIGIVECDYDRGVETSLCPNATLRELCWRIREQIESNGLRRIMSTRFLIGAYTMMEGADWSMETVFETYFEGWSEDEKSRVSASQYTN